MLIFLGLLLAAGLGGYLFMRLHPVFGAAATGPRLARMQRSAQYRGGTFHYPELTAVSLPLGQMIRLVPQLLASGNGTVPADTLPTVAVRPQALHRYPATAPPRITWLGHSSYLIETSGLLLAVDPVLSRYTSFLQGLGTPRFPMQLPLQAGDFPGLDAIILTHDHYDHLDYLTITALSARTGHFYVPLGVGAHLERWGVSPKKITELDWYESTALGPLRLTATPARHFSGRGLTRNVTLWSSYVLQTPQARLYLGGDSGYGPHFKQIGEKYGPFELVLLECGQYNLMWHQIHMLPEETAQAAHDLQGKMLLPVHWGAFKLALHPWQEPMQRLLPAAARLSLPVTTPQMGEPYVVDSLPNTHRWWAGLK